jgi:ribonuclease HII
MRLVLGVDEAGYGPNLGPSFKQPVGHPEARLFLLGTRRRSTNREKDWPG